MTDQRILAQIKMLPDVLKNCSPLKSIVLWKSAGKTRRSRRAACPDLSGSAFSFKILVFNCLEKSVLWQHRASRVGFTMLTPQPDTLHKIKPNPSKNQSPAD